MREANLTEINPASGPGWISPGDIQASNTTDQGKKISTESGIFEYSVVLAKEIKNQKDLAYWNDPNRDPLKEGNWFLLRCATTSDSILCNFPPEINGNIIKKVQYVRDWQRSNDSSKKFIDTHTIVSNITDFPETYYYVRKVSDSSEASSSAAESQLEPTSSDPNSITNYKVGKCVENPRGSKNLWQQLADGTWAPPGDSLNSCQGVSASNIFSNVGLNSSFPYLQNIGFYPWGTNYPGGYGNYSDYFLNCVLAQSIVARAECQAFPKIGDFYLNPYNSTNSLTVAAKIEGIPIAAQIPLSEKVANVVKTVAMGWTLGQLFK